MTYRARLLCLLLTTATLSACGTSRHYYDTTMIRHEPMPTDKRAAVAFALADEFGGRTVIWVDPHGAEHRIRPSGEGFDVMDTASLHALWLTAAVNDADGAEFDFMIATNAGPRPVSVLLGLDDVVRVVAGPDRPRWLPEARSPSALRAAYGIGSLESDGATWDTKSYRALDAALGRLSPRELTVLREVSFVRRRTSQDPRKGALYYQKGCEAIIYIYDNSLKAARYQFAGEPDAPLPPMTLTALHEIGHALHERPSHVAGCEHTRGIDRLKRQQEAFNDRITTRNRLARRVPDDPSALDRLHAMDRELDRERRSLLKAQKQLKIDRHQVEYLTHRGPVITAFEHALGEELPPTKYGEVSSKEAFAEAFALFHADPNALRRASPALHAWFERGGHLAALADAVAAR
jgi:hypothetical protein